MIVSVFLAVLVITVGLWKKLQSAPLTGGGLAIGALALLLIPLAVSMTTGGRIAGPDLRLPPSASALQTAQRELQMIDLSQFLLEEGRSTSSIALGTVNAREAAPFIVSGIPSIAIGGFSGNDPVFTLDSFRAMEEVEGPSYFLMPGRRTNNNRRDTPQELILNYIRSHWQDKSRSLDLQPGTLYMNPNSVTDS